MHVLQGRVMLESYVPYEYLLIKKKLLQWSFYKAACDTCEHTHKVVRGNRITLCKV